MGRPPSKKQKFVCFACPKIVYRVPHRIPKSGRVACSKKCSGKWRLIFEPAPLAEVECGTCGKKFRKKKSVCKGERHFCKRECYTEDWASRMEKIRPLIDRSFMQTPEYREAQRLSHLREKSFNWKGGRHLSKKKGYGTVPYVKHDDFQSMRTKNGYVRESRIVVARLIGRSLEKGEVVHHQNGNPADNSAGNLVLFPTHAAHMRHHAGKFRGKYRDAIWAGNPKNMPAPQPVAPGLIS